MVRGCASVRTKANPGSPAIAQSQEKTTAKQGGRRLLKGIRTPQKCQPHAPLRRGRVTFQSRHRTEVPSRVGKRRYSLDNRGVFESLTDFQKE
jgi:hypothetical protein